MKLRKLNAILSLFTTFIVMIHAISHGIWMLTGFGIKIPKILPWVSLWLMASHAILSIVLAVLGHKGAEKRKCRGYANMNRPTYIQRASGISLIIFTALHVLGTAGPLTPPPLVHKTLPLLFFAVVLLHIAISTSKAFVTLGIGNAKVVKVVDIATKVLCAIALVIVEAGFYMYAF